MITNMIPSAGADRLTLLGQKAFAIAISQACPGLSPEADKVGFTPGILFHRCRYDTGDGLIFVGNFYHRELQKEDDGLVCIIEVEDYHGPQPYLSPHSWHHLFGIPDEYDRMRDREILNWTSDMNSLHMVKNGELEYIIQSLFMHTDTLVDGTTRAQVSVMTQFKKIKLLERLHEHSSMRDSFMGREIGAFLEDINKDAFRTVEDFDH